MFPITKTNRFILFKDIAAVYADSHTKLVQGFCTLEPAGVQSNHGVGEALVSDIAVVMPVICGKETNTGSTRVTRPWLA